MISSLYGAVPNLNLPCMITIINQIHRTIKFTYELSETKLIFLDVTLYKGKRFNQNHILDIRTHIKSTNKQLYVHATSYHPPTTINAISKGETNRYLRTNSNEYEFRNMKQKLTNRLLQRGYKYKQILPHIESIKDSNSHSDKYLKPRNRNWFLSHNSVTMPIDLNK